MIPVRSLVAAVPDAARKLDPRVMVHNPVMFVVEVGSVLTTALFVVTPSVFVGAIAGWLWLTVVFANLAEAVAEGRGRAQAATLRAARRETEARRLLPDGGEERVAGTELRPATPAWSRPAS
jgi:potassium-transporting ATPase ATP-binding subunit